MWLRLNLEEVRRILSTRSTVASFFLVPCTDSNRRLLEKAGLEVYQIGKTKAFLRARHMAELDARWTEVLGRPTSNIQRKVHSLMS
ncbi:hypothetical protein HanHA300_Chr02g0043271 [Helianthus annuus]|nr:hypothetical protein HanHA300_Chr02g0043271 [Helianthus annuus]KAJ0617876.1 hypothetical protein HanHA89_Chr02g0046721 [Helianthus annuus]